jgi:hypothetical protein
VADNLDKLIIILTSDQKGRFEVKHRFTHLSEILLALHNLLAELALPA